MPQTKLLLTLLTSLTLTAGLALPPLAAAQTTQQTAAFTITGLVVERDGSPLYGVIVRAGNAKTMTNAGGRFTLTLATRPEGGRQSLTLSAVGKKTQQVTFVEGHPIRVVLEDAVGEIKEVVVRARPNINALDLRARSGVVAQVDMKLLAQKPMIDLSLALQGAVPGLTVVNRGELGMKPEIRIRGNNSFTKGDAANEPLYVLDGKIISPQAFMTLNPLDIRDQGTQGCRSDSALWSEGCQWRAGDLLTSWRLGPYVHQPQYAGGCHAAWPSDYDDDGYR